MNDIWIKPADTSDPNYQRDLDIYNAAGDGIRKRISPDILVPISATDLPNDFIDDPIYVMPAEIKVLADKETTATAVAALDRTGSEYKMLLLLVQVRIAIELVRQIPQELTKRILQRQVGYAEIDLDKLIASLEETYETIQNPTTATGSGLGSPVVLVTDSKLGYE